MESIAKLINSQYSPRKMRLLADLIRGMRADKALFVLKVHEKRMYAHQLEKVLRSAIANWKQANPDVELTESDLYVSRVFIDGGKMLKRVQPAPQGRAHRILKRSNHITVAVDTKTLAPIIEN